ncbi:phage head closure protein [Chelativorans sp. Marseille-P2723]|uniref:phage head closure protein n=1 Tax=Chelativorans sp. Marseille-P2723 TaxID=2709133 RepID=UPI001FEF66A6|nr:phage head closure protein [Chelativorans sp. Marseille-P2723]
MLFIDPGRFRTELKLQKAKTVQDGLGGHSVEWREIGVVLAHVEPVSAQSRFRAGQFHETVSHRITLRFRQDVRSGMRFVKQGRALEIVGVQDADETGRYLICLTREEGR